MMRFHAEELNRSAEESPQLAADGMMKNLNANEEGMERE
jgi:hypothetical protein